MKKGVMKKETLGPERMYKSNLENKMHFVIILLAQKKKIPYLKTAYGMGFFWPYFWMVQFNMESKAWWQELQKHAPVLKHCSRKEEVMMNAVS